MRSTPKLHNNYAPTFAASKTHVTVLPLACSDSDKVIDLFVSPTGNTGTSSICQANASLPGQTSRSYKVHALPLDVIMQQIDHPKVDLLKIDVEGAELKVLRGAHRLLNAMAIERTGSMTTPTSDLWFTKLYAIGAAQSNES